MVPGQETNSDNLGFFFLFPSQLLYDEAILMNTHNIQFNDKIRRFP